MPLPSNSNQTWHWSQRRSLTRKSAQKRETRKLVRKRRKRVNYQAKANSPPLTTETRYLTMLLTFPLSLVAIQRIDWGMLRRLVTRMMTIILMMKMTAYSTLRKIEGRSANSLSNAASLSQASETRVLTRRKRKPPTILKWSSHSGASLPKWRNKWETKSLSIMPSEIQMHQNLSTG